MPTRSRSGLLWIYIAFALLALAISSRYKAVCRDVPGLPTQVIGHDNPSLLLLIAHPDDESMFFAPLLYALGRAQERADLPHLKVVCLSNGDADGLGKRRSLELEEALRVYRLNMSMTIIEDPGLQDGFGNEWSPLLIASIMEPFVEANEPLTIFTFDHLGISGHPNHRACLAGALEFARARQGRVQVWQLDSVSLIRKYLGPLSLLAAERPSPTFFRINGCRAGAALGRRAMTKHESQLTWYRRIYIVLSSYMYTTTFTRVV